MRKFLFWEIEPKSNSGASWICDDIVTTHLGTADFSKLMRVIRDKARDIKHTWNEYRHNPSEARFRRGGLTSCLWVLCMYLYYYDHDTPENVKDVKEYAELWGIDESVMLEMQDIAQAYKLLEPYARDEHDYGTKCVRPEAADDKRALDTSVEALIELG